MIKVGASFVTLSRPNLPCGHLATLAFVLALFCIGGCSGAKVVSVSRQKQASTPMDDGKTGYASAASGQDILVIRVDTGQSGSGMPKTPTLSTLDGKKCNNRGVTWNKGMGSTIEVWFDVPENQTQFNLLSGDKIFIIDTARTK